jgi:hypothetical protein
MGPSVHPAALVPHLTAGLRAAAIQAALAARPSAQTGVVVLGPDGRIELANGIAQRLLARPARGMRHSYLTAVSIVAAMLERADRARARPAGCRPLPKQEVIGRDSGLVAGWAEPARSLRGDLRAVGSTCHSCCKAARSAW